MTDCCDQAYICPTTGETECLTHGGFDVCCDHPDCPGGRPRKYVSDELARRRRELAPKLEAVKHRCPHGMIRQSDLVGPMGFSGPVSSCDCCRSTFGFLTDQIPPFCRTCDTLLSTPPN